jgi:DNA-directed RNA polymerase specialized sigma24 family protein
LGQAVVGHGESGNKPQQVAPWEFDLIQKVASRFETTEREDLEAELGRILLRLKVGKPAHVQDWKSYLAKALLNKASNWIRDRRLRQSRIVPLIAPGEEESGAGFITGKGMPGLEIDDDFQLALKLLRNELGPDLLRLWELLIEENGNQLAVARRLRVHRNTVRLWIRKIRQVLELHGFLESDSF